MKYITTHNSPLGLINITSEEEYLTELYFDKSSDSNKFKENYATKDLKIFDQFLELENDNHICFICGKKIEDADLSRDHVIPWSYIYSDDLWNLVYVHKGCNSGKSNITPSQERIDKLKERNLLLQAKMHDKFKSNSKILQEFDYAIKNDFVDKFYLGCKGC